MVVVVEEKPALLLNATKVLTDTRSNREGGESVLSLYVRSDVHYAWVRARWMHAAQSSGIGWYAHPRCITYLFVLQQCKSPRLTNCKPCDARRHRQELTFNPTQILRARGSFMEDSMANLLFNDNNSAENSPTNLPSFVLSKTVARKV